MRVLFASLVTSVLLLTPLACSANVEAGVDGATPALQAAGLYERDWQWQLRYHPEKATALGDRRYNARLSDTSLAARQAAREHERRMLDAANAIDRAQLSAPDQVSYDLFVAAKEQALAAAMLSAFDPQPITAYDGLQLRLPRLVAQMPFQTDADYLDYLARLQAVPAHVDGLIAQLRAGVQAGWTTPRVVVAPVPDALRALRDNLSDGALGAPFQRIPASIAPDVRAQLRAIGAATLADTVAPALARLERFLRQEYVPTARESIGAGALPGGADWYALLVRNATTTALTPAQVHALGLQEVARLRAAIERVIPRTGYRGGFDGFIAFARSDRRLFFTSSEALLDRYRRTLALVQARLGRVVEVMPDAGIVVKPMSAPGPGQPAAFYEAGSRERTAALVVDSTQLAARPIWQVDTVTLHEAVPGHHLQVARAQELEGLPAFRRHGWYDAFGEGWATYAEGLGPELGLFQDPFSLFGHLNEEMFRAARLVVDTGIHAMGWSRRQAIDYLNAHTANPPLDNAAEVDRYIARPAQALGYKIGQLRILALRTQARAALGARFDLRRFHDALLAGGALPLPELERQMGRWIATEKAPLAPAPEAKTAPSAAPDLAPAAPAAPAPAATPSKPPSTPSDPAPTPPSGASGQE
ncbi:DUF885 family protein [Massilia sp. YIM B02443]|uniref:DUF885 domain-containing protein n=1 Tax=Massilia sp. YIM B02443 TaxID=3050127 RepID=UPI0025B640F9|nr:DUF885 domain-containing protein [Massilia sp. YIM B02443]MDN4037194.1 DUF885 domain-containing protein [Massilia sp. YIM B02443]